MLRSVEEISRHYGGCSVVWRLGVASLKSGRYREVRTGTLPNILRKTIKLPFCFQKFPSYFTKRALFKRLESLYLIAFYVTRCMFTRWGYIILNKFRHGNKGGYHIICGWKLFQGGGKSSWTGTKQPNKAISTACSIN